MRAICYLGVAFVAWIVALLGCNEGPRSAPPELSPPAPPASLDSGTRPVESPLISVTEKAAATVKEIIREGQSSGTLPKEKVYLRIRVIPGGCQGYQHKVDLDPHVSPEDDVCVSAGIDVVTLKRQAEMLKGTRVDFGDENGQLGFKVDSPNLKGESAKRWIGTLENEKDVK